MGYDSREAFYRARYRKDEGFLEAGDIDREIAAKAARLNGILDAFRAGPLAERLVVFGSAARGRFLPGDIDVAIDLRQGDPVSDRDLHSLIAVARRNYGWVDPFVILPNGHLQVRDENASGWMDAKHARAIKAAIRDEGRPLAEVAVSPDPTPVDYDPVAWEVEGFRSGWTGITERGWRPDVVLHWQREHLKDTAAHPFPEVRELFEGFAASVPGHVSDGIEVEASPAPRM